MNIERHATKSGHMTLSVEGSYVHSRIDPFSEAERFVDSLDLVPGQTVVLFFPGLEYSFRAIQKKLMGSRIIVIQPARTFFSEWEKLPDETWACDDPISIELFLEQKINETDFFSVQVATWEPLLKLFPSLSYNVRKALLDLMSSFAANINTRSYFGKRWIWNIVGNLLAFDRVIPDYEISGNLTIAASGPSLFDSWKPSPSSRAFIVALPSSVRALVQYKRRMSQLVNSDAGFYAALHLHYIPPEGHPFVTAALRSMLRPFWRRDLTPLLWRVGVPLESELCSAAAGISFKHTQAVFPSLDDKGTVAISALDLSMQHVRGQTLLRGFDLSAKNDGQHVRPHTSEHAPYVALTRVRSIHEAAVAKKFDSSAEQIDSEWWTQGSLKVYRDWMLVHGSEYAGRAFVPLRSHVYVGLEKLSDHGRELFFDDEAVLRLHEPVTLLPIAKRVRVLCEVLSAVSRRLDNSAMPVQKEDPFFDLSSYISPFLHRDYIRASRGKLSSSEELEHKLRTEISNQLVKLRAFVESWI